MIKRLSWAVGMVSAVIVLGTIGYTLIEGWSLFDSLYMTVITVGTVGFGEVHPLSDAGRLFTVFLILAGVAALGFAIGQLLEFLVEGHLTGMLEVRRMEKLIGALSGHTIVAGAGRVGSVVAETLAEEGAQFVVVDVSPEAEQHAKESGWLFIHGDASDESTLLMAGIERAGSIVTALSSDAENLFVTVTARSLSPSVFIVARSSHQTTEAKLLKAGANRTITPNVIGGRRMASMVLHPTVNDYLDIVTRGEGVEFRLQEVELTPTSSFVNRSLASAHVREETGAQVVAILHPDGKVDANPSPETVLRAGERLVVLGTVEQVARLADEAATR